ncbi:MAG: glycosyltransferase [Actinomycetia bacterium]|nr:glycosyltransferase [Actinomycetes bacterium]
MAAPMVIRFVSMHTSPLTVPGAGDAGGMNVVERHQAHALAALGHTVEMVTRRADAESPDVVDVAPRVTLRYLPAGPAEPLAKSAIDEHLEEFGTHLAELPAPDVVHSHHWMSGVAAIPCARRWGVPHVQSFHSVAALPDSPLGEGEPPESPRRVPGERFAAQESDLVVAVSHAEARTVISRLGGDPSRIRIVSPGVDAQLFRPLLRGEEPRRAEPYALFAARLQPLKGADLALAAYAQLDPESLPGGRPRLIIAGDTSADFADYREELDRLVEEHGLADDVEFVGPQAPEELAPMLRSASVVLVPSHSETYGLIALEASASGVPVIASAAGGLTEAVVHGCSGLLIPERDPALWADALRKVLTDSDYAARLGRAGRTHALGFSWEEHADHLVGLYRRVADAARLESTQPDPGPGLIDELREAGTVGFLHAHPDDESLATGALIADLVEHGVRATVLTATRGERGEVVQGGPTHLEGTAQLHEHREGELAGALAALGAEAPQFLGYEDSGMQWINETVAGPADDVTAEALTSAAVDEVAERVVEWVSREGVEYLVTYDSTGGYGHPDHVHLHHVGVLAAAKAGVPLFEVLPTRKGIRWRGEWTELPQTRERVAAALRQHATQITVADADAQNGIVVVHSGGQEELIPLAIGLRRSTTAATTVAGTRVATAPTADGS